MTTAPFASRFRKLLCLLPALTMGTAVLAPAPAASAQDGDKLVKPRLIAEKDHLVAGETNWIGVVFDISREWHIYWRNPGGGMATTWELKDAPEGVTLGEGAVWPLPERYETQYSYDYIHEGRMLVLVPVDVDASVAKRDEVTLTIEANWLVCKDICVPGSRTASVTLPVTDDPSKAKDDRAASLFERARAEAPKPVSQLKDEGIVADVDSNDNTIVLTVEGADELVFYPYENDEGVYPNKPAEDLEKKSDTLTIRYPANSLKLERELRGILAVTKGNSEPEHLEITIPLR